MLNLVLGVLSGYVRFLSLATCTVVCGFLSPSRFSGTATTIHHGRLSTCLIKYKFLG